MWLEGLSIWGEEHMNALQYALTTEDDTESFLVSYQPFSPR